MYSKSIFWSFGLQAVAGGDIGKAYAEEGEADDNQGDVHFDISASIQAGSRSMFQLFDRLYFETACTPAPKHHRRTVGAVTALLNLTREICARRPLRFETDDAGKI
jgi:hypothetical protein